MFGFHNEFITLQIHKENALLTHAHATSAMTVTTQLLASWYSLYNPSYNEEFQFLHFFIK